NAYQGIFGDAVLHHTTVASADYNFWSDLAGFQPFVTARRTSYDGGVIEPHSLAGDPMLMSMSPVVDVNLYSGDPAQHVPNPHFGVVDGLHVASGSPCMNAGADIHEPYPAADGAYDMGAYEGR